MFGVTGKITELNELAAFMGKNSPKQVMAFEDFGKPVRTQSVLSKHRIVTDSHIRTAPTLHNRVRLHPQSEFSEDTEPGFLYLSKPAPFLPKMGPNSIILGKLDILRSLDLNVYPVYYFQDVVAVRVV